MVGRKQSEKTLYLVLTPALLPTGSNCTAAPAHSFSFIPAYLFEPNTPPPSLPPSPPPLMLPQGNFAFPPNDDNTFAL